MIQISRIFFKAQGYLIETKLQFFIYFFQSFIFKFHSDRKNLAFSQGHYLLKCLLFLSFL